MVEPYTLEILSTDIRRGDGETLTLAVTYRGLGDAVQILQDLKSDDLPSLLEGCEEVARKIFHDEFRLNTVVDLRFDLRGENGLRIWHTSPNLYVKCPLTMTMNWSCEHLIQNYKTMTALGVIQLPAEYSLTGNAIGARETARVIMDSMANGVEFMGNIVLMRNRIDHDAEVQSARG